MTVKENLRLVDSMMASYNARDWSKLAEMYAGSALFYEPGVEPYRGRDAILRGYHALHSEFPDEQIRKIRSFGQGDWTCVEMVASGTNKGRSWVQTARQFPRRTRAIKSRLWVS